MSGCGYTKAREAEAADQKAANLSQQTGQTGQTGQSTGTGTGIGTTNAGMGAQPTTNMTGTGMGTQPMKTGTGAYSDLSDPMSRMQLENIAQSERQKLDEAAKQIREAAQLVQEAQGEQWQRSLAELERELQTMEATVQMKQRMADDANNQLNALLAQRADILNRQQQLRDRMAVIQQDINNLSHQLNLLNDSKRQCSDALAAAEAETLRARNAYETKQNHIAGLQNALAQAQLELQLGQQQAHTAKSQLEELESLAKLGKVQITLSTSPQMTTTGSLFDPNAQQQQTGTNVGFGRTAA